MTNVNRIKVVVLGSSKVGKSGIIDNLFYNFFGM